MRFLVTLLCAFLLLHACNKGDAPEEKNKVSFSGDVAEGEAESDSKAKTADAAANPAMTEVAKLKTGAGTPLADEKAQFSYLVGTNVGTQFHREGMELDPKILMEGFMDAMADKVVYNDEQMQAVFNDLQRKMLERQRERRDKEGAINKIAADKFLAENKTKPGVVTTASGLQYKVLTKGKSKQHPTTTQFVKVNYEGHLIDGTVFDSSYKRGTPAVFRCDQVIRGWIEALQLMSPGDTFELYIAPELGYGPEGQGGIPPMACLIFKVELLEITQK